MCVHATVEPHCQKQSLAYGRLRDECRQRIINGEKVCVSFTRILWVSKCVRCGAVAWIWGAVAESEERRNIARTNVVLMGYVVRSVICCSVYFYMYRMSANEEREFIVCNPMGQKNGSIKNKKGNETHMDKLQTPWEDGLMYRRAHRNGLKKKKMKNEKIDKALIEWGNEREIRQWLRKISVPDNNS